VFLLFRKYSETKKIYVLSVCKIYYEQCRDIERERKETHNIMLPEFVSTLLHCHIKRIFYFFAWYHAKTFICLRSRARARVSGNFIKFSWNLSVVYADPSNAMYVCIQMIVYKQMASDNILEYSEKKVRFQKICLNKFEEKCLGEHNYKNWRENWWNESLYVNNTVSFSFFKDIS